MCGNTATCGDRPWAPTCYYVSHSKVWVCSCGTRGYGCDQDTEICNEAESTCVPAPGKIKQLSIFEYYHNCN